MTKLVKKRAEIESASIPSPDVYKEYVGRKIKGVSDMDVLKYAHENALNTLLKGDTGSGKTMVGEAYASKHRFPYYSLPCDISIDPSALFGKVAPTENAGEFQWVDGPVTSIVRHGGVLNISEINYMSPRVAASLYPLLDRRREIPLLGNHGEVVKAHKDLLIIADMNPHYRGTVDINAAFLNRFPLKINWGYDEGVEKKIVGLPPILRAAKKFRDMFGKELTTPVSTNMLADFERFARSFLGLDFAIENFVACFRPDERKSVYDVLDLERIAFERELNPVTEEDAEVIDDDDDDNEFEFVDEKADADSPTVKTWNPVQGGPTVSAPNAPYGPLVGNPPTSAQYGQW